MASLPQLSDFFDTLREYRHSTTIALVLLYLTPFFFPVGWDTVGATWQFVAGLMFFLSLGMIITEDAWPWVKKKFNIGKGRDPETAKLIVEACESKDSVLGSSGPPFELVKEDLESFGEAKEFCEAALSPEDDFTTSENAIIITESGIEKLRKQI